jgi:hypothetical protein
MPEPGPVGVAGRCLGRDPLDAQRCSGRAQRVVGLAHRGVEDGHDRVADELHDGPSLGQHDGDDDPVIGVERRYDLRRWGALGEGRESLQIGHEHGHLGDRAAQRRRFRVGEQRGCDVRGDEPRNSPSSCR